MNATIKTKTWLQPYKYGFMEQRGELLEAGTRVATTLGGDPYKDGFSNYAQVVLENGKEGSVIKSAINLDCLAAIAA